MLSSNSVSSNARSRVVLALIRLFSSSRTSSSAAMPVPFRLTCCIPRGLIGDKTPAISAPDCDFRHLPFGISFLTCIGGHPDKHRPRQNGGIAIDTNLHAGALDLVKPAAGHNPVDKLLTVLDQPIHVDIGHGLIKD